MGRSYQTYDEAMQEQDDRRAAEIARKTRRAKLQTNQQEQQNALTAATPRNVSFDLGGTGESGNALVGGGTPSAAGRRRMVIEGMPGDAAGLSQDQINSISGMGTYKQGHGSADFNGQHFEMAPSTPTARVKYQDVAGALREYEATKARNLANADRDKERDFQLKMQATNPTSILAGAQAKGAELGNSILQEQAAAAKSDRDRQTRLQGENDTRNVAIREAIEQGLPVGGRLPGIAERARPLLSQYANPNDALNAAEQQAAPEADSIRQVIEELAKDPSPEHIAQIRQLKQKYAALSRNTLAADPEQTSVNQALSQNPETAAAIQELLAMGKKYAGRDTSMFSFDPGEDEDADIERRVNDASGKLTGGYDSQAAHDAIVQKLQDAMGPGGWSGEHVNALMERLKRGRVGAAPAAAANKSWY